MNPLRCVLVAYMPASHRRSSERIARDIFPAAKLDRQKIRLNTITDTSLSIFHKPAYALHHTRDADFDS